MRANWTIYLMSPMSVATPSATNSLTLSPVNDSKKVIKSAISSININSRCYLNPLGFVCFIHRFSIANTIFYI